MIFNNYIDFQKVNCYKSERDEAEEPDQLPESARRI